MTPKEYKSRLYLALTKVESILDASGKSEEVSSIKGILSSNFEQELPEGSANSQLDEIKEVLVGLLNEALEQTQVDFVQLEEPDQSDVELFKSYLLELREYKQELTLPSSKLRRNITTLLRRSRTNLLNELQSQSIMLPTEFLDGILVQKEVEEEYGANWVLDQINEALNSLIEDVNVRLDAVFEAVNEMLGSEIESLDEKYTQSIELNRQSSTSMSDDMFGLARNALPSLGIGSLGYGVGACLLGPIAGVVAGLAAGGFFVWKSQSSSNRQKKVMELKQQLSPKITLAINELRTYVSEKFDDFEESITSNIELTQRALEAEMQDCVDVLKSYETESKDFETQSVLLNNRMTALETHINQLKILNTNPFSFNH